MPELPEVENIAEGLRNEIIGLCIKGIYVKKSLIVKGPYRGSWRKANRKISGSRIVGVTRRGKRLILNSDNNLAIIIQLGMTGKFLLSPPVNPHQKHAHFIINFNKNKQLRFIDSRRFGRVWFIENLDPAYPDPAMENAGLSRLGPEPENVKPRQFQQIINSKRFIKNLLLDQTRLAGLGNIYADESLFRAGIHPAAVAERLTDSQAKKLRTSIRSILKRAIAYGGTTFSDFRNAYGDMGSFKKMLKVYRRTGLPCPRCRTIIERMVISGRGSHFCPRCQPQK